MAIAEGIADSLSSTSPSFSCDKLVVQVRPLALPWPVAPTDSPHPRPPRTQAKVDALKVDPDSYAWYRSRLRIEPRSLHFAQLFVKSALALLATAGLRFHPHDVFHHLDKEVGEEANNPFEYATMLERDDVGVCPLRATAADPGLPCDTLCAQACRTLRARSCARDGGSGPGSAWLPPAQQATNLAPSPSSPNGGLRAGTSPGASTAASPPASSG